MQTFMVACPTYLTLDKPAWELADADRALEFQPNEAVLLQLRGSVLWRSVSTRGCYFLNGTEGELCNPFGIVGQQRIPPAALATLSEKGMSTLRAIAN